VARHLDPAAARAVRIDGLYEHLMNSERAEIRRGDPRAMFIDDPAQRSAANAASPVIKAAVAKLAAMERGEPQTVACWQLTGRTFGEQAPAIPWLTDRSVDHVRVTPDDRITPV
jgi:hypothetical protein